MVTNLTINTINDNVGDTDIEKWRVIDFKGTSQCPSRLLYKFTTYPHNIIGSSTLFNWIKDQLKTIISQIRKALMTNIFYPILSSFIVIYETLPPLIIYFILQLSTKIMFIIKLNTYMKKNHFF